MNFKDAVITGLKKFATFEGRATRSEYWWFVLFAALVQCAASIMDSTGVLSALVSLAFLIPSLSLAARRLHDIDKSGWWQLVGIIPLIGLIVLIVWLCTKGTPGSNSFGPEAS